MDAPATLAMVIFSGVIIESVAMMGKRTTIYGLFLPVLAASALFASYFGFFGLSLGHRPMLVMLAFYIILFTIKNHSLIIQTIDERTLAVYTLAFWHVYLSHFYLDDYFTLAFLAPTLAVLFVCLTRWVPKDGYVLFFYFWYLFCSAALLTSLFIDGAFTIYLEKELISDVGYVESFFAGMVFFPLSVNAILLYYLLPIHEPGKAPIDPSRLSKIIMTRYSSQRMSIFESALIFLLLGGLLVFNSYFGMVDSLTIVNICIVILPPISLGIDSILIGMKTSPKDKGIFFPD